MRILVSLNIMILTLLTVVPVWACNKTTYYGCSPEELRAIQQQQFAGRKLKPASEVNAGDYWRDRQYSDRLRAEDRRHEVELEKIRSETEVEVARQQRRSRGYRDYYYRPPQYHRPPYRPVVKPVPPIAVKPRPELKGNTYSNSSYKRVSNATK